MLGYILSAEIIVLIFNHVNLEYHKIKKRGCYLFAIKNLLHSIYKRTIYLFTIIKYYMICIHLSIYRAACFS